MTRTIDINYTQDSDLRFWCDVSKTYASNDVVSIRISDTKIINLCLDHYLELIETIRETKL